jgi:hypothetical protein
MIKWINLTEEQKRTSISQAALKSGAAERAIEKDWWVTLTLKALFTGPYAQSLVKPILVMYIPITIVIENMGVICYHRGCRLSCYFVFQAIYTNVLRKGVTNSRNIQRKY